MSRRRILVTTPGFDDTGQVLRSMNLAYEAAPGRHDCPFLFDRAGPAAMVFWVALIHSRR